MRAVNHALRILEWQENLSEDEMPPEWMWPIEDALTSWFEKVKEDREKKYGSKSTSSGDESAAMMQNEYAKGRF